METKPDAHPLTDEYFDGTRIASEQPVGDFDDDARFFSGLTVGSMPTTLATVHEAAGQRPLALLLAVGSLHEKHLAAFVFYQTERHVSHVKQRPLFT